MSHPQDAPGSARTSLETARNRFGKYSAELLDRHERAATFLSQIIPTLQDVKQINHQLAQVPTSAHLQLQDRVILPPLSSPADVINRQYAGSFAADFVTVAGNRSLHVIRPAYRRMQALWGIFTTDLVHAMNTSEHLGDFTGHIPELYVAYTAMSHLVDRQDPYVLTPQGVDPDYLKVPLSSLGSRG